MGGEIVASQDVATRAVSASPTLHSFVAGMVFFALRACCLFEAAQGMMLMLTMSFRFENQIVRDGRPTICAVRGSSDSETISSMGFQRFRQMNDIMVFVEPMNIVIIIHRERECVVTAVHNTQPHISLHGF